jgi:hypothetical protein
MTNDFEFHEAANIFPLMTGSDFDEFVEDIRKNGLQVPIELFQGKVIDGRNRYNACKAAGAAFDFIDVSPSDPVDYVLSRNLHRRHLSTSERALVAARARELHERQAKERMSEGGKKAGRGRPQQGMENLPSTIEAGSARDRAAKSVGVSGRTVDYAASVLKHGEPELVQAVEQGRVSVSAAAKAVRRSPEDQVALAKEGSHKHKPARTPKERPVKKLSQPSREELRVCASELLELIQKSETVHEVCFKAQQLTEAILSAVSAEARQIKEGDSPCIDTGEAMPIATMAILQLERIHPKDAGRLDALNYVAQWISEQVGPLKDSAARQPGPVH